MSGIRVLNDGRLVLADGTTLDLEYRWLSKDEARSVAEDADIVVESSGLSSSEVSSDTSAIRELLDDVDESGRPVGARRYSGSGKVALVLMKAH